MKKEVRINPSIIKNFNKNGFYLYKGLFTNKIINNALKWIKSKNKSKLAKSWTEKEPFVPIAVLSSAHLTNSPISRIAEDKKIIDIGQLFNRQKYRSKLKSVYT